MVEKYMKILSISREEALQLIKDDKAIDRGAKMFELDPELAKGAKKARQADRKPSEKPRSRERKPNEDKRHLISLLSDVIPADCAITNPEREFVFVYNETKYKVTLSAPRS